MEFFGFYAVFTAILAVAVANCPAGFFYDNNNFCYAVLRVPATWPEALRLCDSVGAKLAQIESADESTYISSLLTQLKGSIPTNEVWLGGSDMLVEGMWYWADTNEPITYTNWSPNEPNNDHGQHCLAMYRDKGAKWDDYTCDNKLLPLCKRP